MADNDAGHACPLYRYRFGTAEFDAARFELRVRGLLVDVQQLPLQLLAALLSTPGELIGKDVLLNRLWKGRASGDAVLNNAVSKLRSALGADNADRVATVPRQGYRIDGPVERVAVGRRRESRMALAPNAPVPGRESYLLVQLLGISRISETWLARQPKTGDRRVFKFAANGERLADLKREVTLYRVLKESLGDHPGIVPIIDWNFDNPPHWLECEYAGQSLDLWNGDEQLAALDQPSRIALFLQLADAVAAAHGVGVLHKDLKPANVMVREAAGGGLQLRLTDFGSGLLMDPEQLERLHITRLGMTVGPDGAASGTPFYMAPEISRGEPPTNRSDVFALGVILYQFLAGDLRRPMASGWERDIPDELLREDIASATDFEPGNRMTSAAVLADNLRRLEPRRAERAASLAQQARSAEAQRQLAFARARRPWVVAALTVLLVGTSASLWLYTGQRKATALLVEQQQVSTALNRLLSEDLIGAADPTLHGRADITVADALKTAAEQVDRRFGTLDPTVRGNLHAAMQQSLGELSRASEAVAAGRRALAALSQVPAPDATLVQEVRLRLAFDLYEVSRFDDARAVLQDIESSPPTATSASALFQARLLYVKSSIDAGRLSLEASLGLLQRAFALIEPLPESADTVGIRGKIMFALGDDMTMLGRWAQGAAMFERLWKEQTRRLGPEHPLPLFTLVGWGNALSLDGKHVEARQMLERASAGLTAKLGAGHRHTLSAQYMLAGVRYRERDYAGAARDWALALKGYSELLGEGSVTAISTESNIAMAMHLGGRPAQAETMLRDALRRARLALPDAAPMVQQLRYSLADCLLDLNRPAEASPLLEGLQPSSLILAEQEPDWPARLEYQQARVAMGQGRQAAAIGLMEQAANGLGTDGELNRGVARGLLARWKAATREGAGIELSRAR